MDIPRFSTGSINPRLATSDIGEAFQVFIHEVLMREYPNLHRFPAGGKDGAIDLVDTSNGNLVVECKFVGDDKYESVGGRWKDVRKLLEKHLQDPGGPTLGQSQYSPWYSTVDPLSEYWFCVSAFIANDNQRRELRDSIADFFQQLSRRHPHVAHLQDLSVKVVDWSDLTGKLQKQPHLIFRWFPSSRPSGLVPLDEATDVGTFRAYLTNAKLPYYSVAEHLRLMPAPDANSIADEDALLAALDGEETTGLVISGKGGIGKSRLTLELGWSALGRGWTVMRVQKRLKEDTLERFAEKLTADTTALLLVDYIETQSDFGELVETINVLNDSGIARLRYVAACRTNFYHRAIAASERHFPVDLTPPPGSLTVDWFTSYRKRTVERILTEGGLPNSEKYLAVCGNVPILAVFLIYLHTSGRSDDLADLLDEIEFGRWVAKRIQLTFSGRSVSRELALLVPLFPMSESVISQLPTVSREIFENLATDGWIEKVPGSDSDSPDTWVTAHDVLADQILLAYVRSIPATTETLVSELFTLAATVGCLSSAIVSVQRVSDTPPLNSVRWLKVISDAIAANQSAWHEIRGLLIRTTLLSASEQLTLLREYEELWTGAEYDSAFQKSMGWLARRILKYREPVTEQDKDTLVSWVTKAAPLAERSNFVITWGLRLAPDALRDSALHWIVTRPTLLQTHYLMVAWLNNGLGPDPIAPYVEQWCFRFSRSFHLSFLVKAWLDAGGDTAMVRESIARWLVEYRTIPEARFVYDAWLDAKGDTATVQNAMLDWLREHRTTSEARFVYDAWLDVGGDPNVIQAAFQDWLVEHRNTPEARFVYEAWLDAGGQIAIVQDVIRDWLTDHGATMEATFIYKAWLQAGGDTSVVQDAIQAWLREHRATAEATFIYTAWLEAGQDRTFVEETIQDWLVKHGAALEAQFVYTAWLGAGGDTALVEKAIEDWLIEHRTAPTAGYIYSAWLNAGGATTLVQNAIKDWLDIYRVGDDAQFVYNAWLDAKGDPSVVQDAISDWLSEHRTSAQASHVYKAWLDAGGNTALIEEAVRDWLVLHAEDFDADHVFRAWLGARGNRQLVWEAATTWLSKHCTEASAGYVIKLIAKQKDLSIDTVKDVLTWCRTFPLDEDALWRFTQLREHLSLPEVADDVVSTAEILLEAQLEPTSTPNKIAREQILTAFFNLITSRQMQAGQLRERVDKLFVRWIKHPRSFGPNPTGFWLLENKAFLNRLSALISVHALDPVADFEAVGRFLQWVNSWEVDKKLDVLPILSAFKSRHPSPGLWDIVRMND